MAMSLRAVSAAFTAASLMLLTHAATAQVGADGWPQFRGQRAQGVAENQDLPDTWNAETFENIRWKTPITGLGLSSPIVTGERIFIVSAVGKEADPSLKVGLYGNIASVDDEGPQSWQLNCLNKDTGRIEWIRQLRYGEPAIKRHTKASHANSTPATDGMHVVVLLGSEGLHCFDIHGNRRWKKDLGRLDSGFYRAKDAQWGFGSSPIIYQNRVIVQCDVQDDSFVAAFNIQTGDELWRTDRDDVPSWGTPAIHEGQRTQVIVNGYKHSGGYDVWTGEELWQLGWGGDIPVPTPIVSDDLVILSSAHGFQSPLRAVRTEARGKVSPIRDSGKFLAWNKPRDGIYMQTPIVYEDLLYACRNNGVLTCYDVETGKRVYKKRLGGGGFTASAVAADGRLYFTSEDGEVFVVRAGRVYELIAKNDMGEVCMATPAISGQTLIIRTQKHVYSVGKSSRGSTPMVVPTLAAIPHRLDHQQSQCVGHLVQTPADRTSCVCCASRAYRRSFHRHRNRCRICRRPGCFE